MDNAGIQAQNPSSEGELFHLRKFIPFGVCFFLILSDRTCAFPKKKMDLFVDLYAEFAKPQNCTPVRQIPSLRTMGSTRTRSLPTSPPTMAAATVQRRFLRA